MRIVAVITEHSVITKILAHLAKRAVATATERSGPGPPAHPPPGPAPDLSVNGTHDERLVRPPDRANPARSRTRHRANTPFTRLDLRNRLFFLS